MSHQVDAPRSLSRELGLPAGPTLTYDSTVPRWLVHRAAVSEVLLTSWQRVGQETFVCGAQWPRGHSLYAGANAEFDALVIVETVRQAGILVGHEGFGVARRNPFIMQRLRWRLFEPLVQSGSAPFDCVVTVQAMDAQVRPNGTAAIRFEFELHHGGRQLASATGWTRCVSPATYRRLRWGGGSPRSAAPQIVHPVEPSSVGRVDPRDVVIAGSPRDGLELRVPIDHPVFFDHPLDHAPGMMVYEAMRQAACVTAGRQFSMVGADVDFAHFTELDQPCHISVALKPGPDLTRADVQFSQNSRISAQGFMTLAER
ncbi:ScbA/BarX family gamma-butyrolactone biosynthesis protein [Micromonospora sp. NPDC048835]|uniref:ScbA/BarX family gamma-butyrolactone biosynthesis protein n=1 Tax=Micromonospora sp. NPDC048835 TaxID=3155147 RepID=UPI0033FC10F0